MTTLDIFLVLVATTFVSFPLIKLLFGRWFRLDGTTHIEQF